MKHERVYSTDEVDLPDDPETTRMATAVVVFCIFGGPTIATLIMLITIHAEAIEIFCNTGVVYLYHHPLLALILFLAIVYLVIRLSFNRVVNWIFK